MQLEVPGPLLESLQQIRCKHLRLPDRQEELPHGKIWTKVGPLSPFTTCHEELTRRPPQSTTCNVLGLLLDQDFDHKCILPQPTYSEMDTRLHLRPSMSSQSVHKPPYFVRNETAAQPDKLVGAKHQAVRNVLQLPRACQDSILDSVSFWGWEGSLSWIWECCLLGVFAAPL